MVSGTTSDYSRNQKHDYTRASALSRIVGTKGSKRFIAKHKCPRKGAKRTLYLRRKRPSIENFQAIEFSTKT
jgi:hypothetical protein